MIAKNGINPIPVPRECSNTAGLGAFSRDVIAAIKALRDRRVIYDVPRVSTTQLLPFQIYVDGTTLKAAAGVFATATIGVISEATPADGTWTLEGVMVIDDTDGSFLSADVDWVATPNTDTTTDFYYTIGTIEVVSGVPDTSTIVQYNYGPIVGITHGGIDDVWAVTFF